MEKELAEKLKECLANTFCFYLKAHNYHWNVQGIHFSHLHAFFGDLYTEVWGAVDQIAEQIRTLDAFAPGSLKRFGDLSEIEDELTVPDAMEMVIRLKADNMKLIECMKEAQKMAVQADAVGIDNFLQGRIDIHFKHHWMLTAISKV
jgi:starvation-inducible DNA-binding protein